MWRLLPILAGLGVLGLLVPWSHVAALVLSDASPTEMRETEDGVAIAALGRKAPLPDWVQLPGGVHVVKSAVFSPTPAKGTAVAVEASIETGADALVASYEAELQHQGFVVTRWSEPSDRKLNVDGALDADQPRTGRRIGLLLRHDGLAHVAEITFWSPGAQTPAALR